MRAAEQVVKFYGEKGVAVPDVYEDLERFYQNEKMNDIPQDGSFEKSGLI